MGLGGVSLPSDHPVADGAQLLDLALHLIPALRGGTGGHGGICPQWGPLCPTRPQPHLSPRFPLTLRKTGGFRKTPTPAGVPVSRMSPGTSVTNLGAHEVSAMAWCQPGLWGSPAPPHSYRDTQATRAGTPKMRWRVLLSCIRCPLTLQRIHRLCTSAGGDTGDMGTVPPRPHLGEKHGGMGNTGL